ncbi:MAG: sialate O-acetylesterase [Mariniblastus sp.]|nr:sialate O-acetylesterase [Mariniblastus sp.]
MRMSVLLVLLGITGSSVAEAELRVPRIFSDQMVLQQQTANAIWGWATPGQVVTAKSSWGAEAQTTAGPDGRWQLFLETGTPATGHTLTLSAENTIEINQIAIGEVWLCAGQSNMGWSTQNSFEADQETEVNLPDLRIFRSEREHWHEPLEINRDRLARWKACDPQAAAETSAVAYYFGKTLQQELGIPVGIIQRAYAGTPIEGWMPWEIQQDDPRARQHRQRLDTSAQRRISNAGPTVEKALADFHAELADYDAKIDAGQTMKNRWKSLGPPIITQPANLGHQYPGHLYNAMIYPIQPYGIRGMIWYQGERNSKDAPQAVHYRGQLSQLIDFYRHSWHERSAGNVPDDFPFQFTQLPSWNEPQQKPVEGLEAPWAVNRDAMRLVDRDVVNTGMVVSIDTGDAIALHPKNKKPIGIRHAHLALQNTYGKKITGSGPRYIGHQVEQNRVVLDFDRSGSGLMAAQAGPLNGFAIAGLDRKWHWAEARMENNQVIVSSINVPQPVAVRYAWAMNPSRRNLLYNRQGFPASPFRTDDWPLFQPDDEIVTVNKPEKPDGYQSVDWNRPAIKPLPGR